jgi:hypothetical protein
MQPNFGTPTATRWALDVNGDGLKDFVSVYITDPSTVVTSINTGKGFAPDIRQTLPSNTQVGSGWRSTLDSGVRIVDYNFDGREDLSARRHEPRSISSVPPIGWHGRFNRGKWISAGDPADGWSRSRLNPVPTATAPACRLITTVTGCQIFQPRKRTRRLYTRQQDARHGHEHRDGLGETFQ